MGLVFENEEFPYYKDSDDMTKMFNKIVEDLGKWLKTKSSDLDDECDGIISTIYRLYENKDDHEPELIVRVVQILAQYDDNEEKSKYLQDIYKILFDFWHDHVIPELKKYLQKDKEIIRLNGILGLLASFSNRKIKFSSSKNI